MATTDARGARREDGLEVEFRPEEQRLREDVRVLGRLLGDALERLEGTALFAHVELARQSSIGRRRGDAEAKSRLERLLTGLDPEEALGIARAFSVYFSLVNTAEQVQRIRRRREYRRAGAPQPESFKAILHKLAAAGVDAAAAREYAERARFTPVFTAHPTEATRRTLLVKESRVAALMLAGLLEAEVGPEEAAKRYAALRDEIGIAWQTDDHFEQPSVGDEVEHVLYYLVNVLYEVAPSVRAALAAAMSEVYGAEAGAAAETTLLRVATWVGGDMDGNPSVDADTIRTTLARHHELITERYRAELETIFDHLSQSEDRVAVLPALRARIAAYRAEMPAVADRLPARYRDMPYRVFLSFVWARLGGESPAPVHRYEDVAGLIGDLALLRDSLQGHGATGARLVEALLERVAIFGLHLAMLDVRQDSAVHREAVAEALARPGFADLPPKERLALLRGALPAANAATTRVTPAPGEALDRTLAALRAIAEGQSRYGPRAIGLYIISMAEDADDALAVLYLARLAGLADAEGGVPLDVALLFETVDDLQRAPGTLTALLADPEYRAHLDAREARQYLMLGYSDSNKESGLAAARWALHEAHAALLGVAANDPRGRVDLVLFHGRGGTPSRGGGKIRDGILAEPGAPFAGKLRVTEQGEIIAQKYGLPEIAERSLETAVAALLERSAFDPEAGCVEPEWREAVRTVAETSRGAYHARVHDDPDLIEFFRRATPIDVIERLRIGSRPPARRGRQKLADVGQLRAIPWVFAWTQSRNLFSGWYGVGTGLAAARARHGVETLQAMARQWRFFANVLADTEMVLAKADMDIARRYAELAGDTGARVFPTLVEEFERTRAEILAITGADTLLARDPVLQRAIMLRNPYVDPLSFLQVDLLARWRATGREDPDLERVLVTTVRGIARGLQNTG